MTKEGELSIVTEVGAFGSLTIEDPTVIPVTEKSLAEEIEDAIQRNSEAL